MCLQALVDVTDCASISTLLASKVRDESDDNLEIFLLTISEIVAYVIFSWSGRTQALYLTKKLYTSLYESVVTFPVHVPCVYNCGNDFAASWFMNHPSTLRS